MSYPSKATSESLSREGFFAAMWKHRLWWMLPLGVLLVLLGAIYALEHLSKTDSEMYPTSSSSRVSVPYSS
jgi:hypothetical protein